MNVIITPEDLFAGRKVKYLGQAANPTITGAGGTAAFKPPEGVVFICLTIATAAVYFTFDPTAATSATIGNGLPVGVHYLPWNTALMRLIKAFSSTGTFFVTFWGWD